MTAAVIPTGRLRPHRSTPPFHHTRHSGAPGRPFRAAFPLPNGPSLGGGLASFSFPFGQRIDQDYVQARLDHSFGGSDHVFVRYTLDRAEQRLPTDFPQFPRTFESRNQFATAEYRRVLSPATFGGFVAGIVIMYATALLVA